jgi:peroxiredoxin
VIEQLPPSAKKVLGIILLIAALFFLLTLLSSKPVPDSVFTSITGKTIALQQLRGKPVLVTFWATDCPSCIEEIPYFIDLYNRYHHAGLEIVAIAMIYDPPSRVVAMTQANQIPYDVVLDLKSEHAKAFGQVQLTPSTFLIGPEGDWIMKKVGLIDQATMKAQIETLLKG